MDLFPFSRAITDRPLTRSLKSHIGATKGEIWVVKRYGILFLRPVKRSGEIGITGLVGQQEFEFVLESFITFICVVGFK